MDFRQTEGRIWAENGQGRVLAEVTFPTENGVAVIDHTFVDDSLRGQGVAGQLLEAAAAQLRAEGKRAVPTCSYAQRWFEQHPEAGNLLRGAVDVPPES